MGSTPVRSRWQTIVAAGLALLLGTSGVRSAGLYTNDIPQAGQLPGTYPLTGNELVPADTQLPAGVGPATEAISVQQLANFVGSSGGFGSPFAPNGSYTTLTAGTSSSSTALPANLGVVVVGNTGLVPVFVNLGITGGVVATTSELLVPPGAAIALSVGFNGYIAGITASSSATLNIGGGSGGLLSGVGGSSGGGGGSTSVTIVALDVATVTTGGTAVTTLAASHRAKGGWLFNPVGATQPLCINEITTAAGTVSAGSLTCIGSGQRYDLAPSTNAVSVVSSDSAHSFSGVGFE